MAEIEQNRQEQAQNQTQPQQTKRNWTVIEKAAAII